MTSLPGSKWCSAATEKRLVSTKDGPPLLAAVPPQEYQGLRGRGYASSADPERFKVDCPTLARVTDAKHTGHSDRRAELLLGSPAL